MFDPCQASAFLHRQKAGGMRVLWLGLTLGGAIGGLAMAPGQGLAAQADAPIISFSQPGKGFAIVEQGQAAPIIRDPGDAAVVGHAVEDLAGDIKVITGVAPMIAETPAAGTKVAIIVGTLGKSAIIDRIVAEKKIDVGTLKGAWESFLITSIDRPVAGVDKALVVIGSDRRGTAYGTYEISQSAGVSPWTWWADVTPQPHPALFVNAGLRRFGPPSVQYRGIFINDEDWGLFPWASRTFDPAYGNIGPKTYRKVFELLLRLRANTLWPAMHKTSQPFNLDPENARLADEYGIVMGSSHAEPMLRNNLGEWKDKPEAFNYAINPEGVRKYWEERVTSNAKYESLWTLGMRGIHDSSMVGASTDAERINLLNMIIADERGLLQKHISPTLQGAHQVFVPYKEVLDIYRAGLKIPDDVTIIWPDDNYGYIRQFANASEQARSGGAGVYYHISYLGTPLAYLWLNSTPPALIKEEMTRAYDHGARKVWIVNVGDIKPGEIGTSLFMDMAWDIDRWRNRSQNDFLTDWAGHTFGEGNAKAVASVLDQYYRLNYETRPEHVGWPAITDHVKPTLLTHAQADARLRRFDRLVTMSRDAAQGIPASLGDAYFELVDYPVRASSAINVRAVAADRYDDLKDEDPAMASSAAGAAAAADADLAALTSRFNNEIAGGKWRNIMAVEPADTQWRIFRTSPFAVPAVSLRGDPKPFFDKVLAEPKNSGGVPGPAIRSGSASVFLEALNVAPPSDDVVIVEAETARGARGWRFIESLGRGDGSMMASQTGASLALEVTVPAGAPRPLNVGLLPFYADTNNGALEIAVSIDGGPVKPVLVHRVTEASHRTSANASGWAQGVLDNMLTIPTGLRVAQGHHRVEIRAVSTGVAVDRLMLPAK
ncbi:glycosyl hydrolase 115 family protein [Novosphingobium terrae]|uniref:glycosyl hydrolase 115 family protein n=1 Tax=Novosphingobium terrae TaxID=2726189 RepID=UPI001F1419E4|nr:glycosyl hydrolase 115 family protein [Novosphingobium terrae]